MRCFPARVVTALVLASAAAEALDVGTTAAIKASVGSIAGGLVQLYLNADSQTDAGLFGGNNSWWEDGAAFGSLIDYWALTGDNQYNNLVQRAISVQAGPDGYLLPASQAATEGNSAQAIWALTALSGAEQSFPSGNITLLDSAKSVFDQHAARWDDYTCGGGLRSTLSPSNANYHFKDAFSVGTFFQLAARLALLTGNGTYTLWANKAYNWASTVGIINTSSYYVYEGSDSSTNCSSVKQIQWSANAATFLYGSALMFNLTSMQTWVTRTESFITATNTTFFQNDVVFEPSCNGQCTPSQRAFKALLVRWIARAALVAPFAKSGLQQILAQNGKVIADDCMGSSNSTCIIGGTSGLPEQMTALDSVNALLVGRATDSSSGGGGSSPTTTRSVSSPTAKSTASSFILSVGGLLTAFFIASNLLLLS